MEKVRLLAASPLAYPRYWRSPSLVVGPRARSLMRGRSWLPAPPLAEVLSHFLRAPVAREHALLVAVDAHDPRRRGEVGEVPDLLADDCLDAVEHPVRHGQELGLVLLGPGDRHDAVQPAKGVGAVLGHDDRLLVLRGPRPQLRLEPPLGGGQVTGVDVPAVVAVEHDHVE